MFALSLGLLPVCIYNTINTGLRNNSLSLTNKRGQLLVSGEPATSEAVGLILVQKIIRRGQSDRQTDKLTLAREGC